MGHTPSRVRPNAQSTGSVGKLTRLDRQNDHSIRQLGDDTSTPTVEVHSFEAVAAQAYCSGPMKSQAAAYLTRGS